MNKNNLSAVVNDLDRIIIFRNLKNDSVLKNLKKILKNKDFSQLSDLIYTLVDTSIREGVKGDIWHNYLKNIIISSENIFTLKAERGEINFNSSLYRLVRDDFKIISQLFSFSFKDLLSASTYQDLDYLANFNLDDLEFDSNRFKIYQKLFTANSAEKNLEELLEFYYQYGASILNQSRAFYWQNDSLSLVNNPDPISFDDLVFYQKAQKKLIENTESFLAGFKAHNALLYGDSGTGKSSSVKALVNKFYRQGLRLIEINSSQIKELPAILEYLNNRGLFFIIFMDSTFFTTNKTSS
ncbi:MAG: DUF815 domain-containing protein, partial [Halanaerobium sp.]